jgi:hypothetical protein
MSRRGWESYTPEERQREVLRRKRQRAAYHRQKDRPLAEVVADQEERDAAVRSVQAAEQIERVQLRRWLVAHAHILWSEPTEDPVKLINSADYSWLSGSSHTPEVG